jgi:formylglycine-generating enzyme required for sulfatase activity
MQHSLLNRLFSVTMVGIVIALSSTLACKRGSVERISESHPRAATSGSSSRELVLNISQGITLRLALMPAGEFWMGSPASESSSYHDRGHSVTLSQPFYIGRYEVTQEQYEAVMGRNPSFGKLAQLPVTQVSWGDATEFCRRLTTMTGKTVRLPTEAEWEYACKAGSKAMFCYGDDAARLNEFGWYSENRPPAGPATVGQKKPNAFGLYDMHGNVSEWCGDYYAMYPANAQSDPTGPSEGETRIIRGGNYFSNAESLGSYKRDYNRPSTRERYLGFRVVVE